jgi:hypothetical protein
MSVRNPPIPLTSVLGVLWVTLPIYPGCICIRRPRWWKQAEKAERMGRAVSDAEISQSFMNMAKAYRSQADMLKTKKPMAKKESGKKRR